VRGEVIAAGWPCVTYESAADAVRAARAATFPNYVIMDLGLPGEDAMAAIAALTQSKTSRAVIALTGHASDDYVFRALRSGAVGYVLKSDGLGRIAEVLNEVAGGGSPMSPSIARRVVATFRADPEPQRPALTDRERDVLEALGTGHTYGSAAALLGISVDTVRQHVRKLYRKLHASSKAEAIAVAMRAGWIE
jgi:DNA-binding NarL/FixJ family response regulator